MKARPRGRGWRGRLPVQALPLCPLPGGRGRCELFIKKLYSTAPGWREFETNGRRHFREESGLCFWTLFLLSDIPIPFEMRSASRSPVLVAGTSQWTKDPRGRTGPSAVSPVTAAAGATSLKGSLEQTLCVKCPFPCVRPEVTPFRFGKLVTPWGRWLYCGSSGEATPLQLARRGLGRKKNPDGGPTEESC